MYYSKPKVLIQVGNVGDVGSVEMQDLLFTTRGATAGLILIEWNIQAGQPGSAALVSIRPSALQYFEKTAGSDAFWPNREPYRRKLPHVHCLSLQIFANFIKWDCHARVGGATGTKLTPAECPPVTSGIDQGCSAASLIMHLTPSASGYFENMWLWGADHMLEYVNPPQCEA